MDKIAKVRAEIERLKHQSAIDSDRQAERGLQSASISSFGKVKACEELLSFIDSMQEEPKECMYSKANYTNDDRLTLCKDCKELCKYNQKTAAESLGISQEVYDEIVDKCLYGSEVELVDDGDLPKEEPASEDLDLGCGVIWKKESVSEDLEEAIEQYCVKHGYISIVDGYYTSQEKVSDIARHFANWQKQQMEAYRIEHCESLTNEQAELEDNFVSSHVEKNNRIPTFIDAIEYGIEYGKQQMLTKAVDAVVNIDAGGYPYIPQMELYDYDKDIPLAKEGEKVKVIIIKEE